MNKSRHGQEFRRIINKSEAKKQQAENNNKIDEAQEKKEEIGYQVIVLLSLTKEIRTRTSLD